LGNDDASCADRDGDLRTGGRRETAVPSTVDIQLFGPESERQARDAGDTSDAEAVT
jgi:hypothetical protein